MDRQKRRTKMLSGQELVVYTCHPSMFSATDALPALSRSVHTAQVDTQMGVRGTVRVADKVARQAFVVPSPDLVTQDNSDDDFVEVLFTPYAHCMYGESLTCPP